MKSISGKKFTKLLESKGWVLLRINGSHHIYSKLNNYPFSDLSGFKVRPAGYSQYNSCFTGYFDCSPHE